MRLTLLRLAPALIWESGERPAPFAGTVEIDATPAENDASRSAPAPSVSVNPAQGGQEPPIWEGDSTTDRFTARSPARARRHGGFARDGGLG